MSLLSNLIMTGTALAPVLFVYAVVALLEGEFVAAAAVAGVGFFLVAVGISLLNFIKGHLEKFTLRINSVEVADRESVGLLVLYLVPLLRTSFSELEYVVLVPAVAIFLALAFTGYNFHFNPLLRVAGWNFYKVGTPEGVTHVLITRRNLRSASGTILVGELTNYTVIDLEH